MNQVEPEVIEDQGHYFCSGSCHGVSDHPGLCQAADCNLFNQPLIDCRCKEGKDSHQVSLI